MLHLRLKRTLELGKPVRIPIMINLNSIPPARCPPRDKATPIHCDNPHRERRAGFWVPSRHGILLGGLDKKPRVARKRSTYLQVAVKGAAETPFRGTERSSEHTWKLLATRQDSQSCKTIASPNPLAIPFRISARLANVGQPSPDTVTSIRHVHSVRG